MFLKFNNKAIYKFIVILIPAFFCILGVLLTTYLKTAFDKTEQGIIDRQSQFSARELSKNLTQLIVDRAKILERAAHTHPEIFPQQKDYYDKVTQVIHSNIYDFYSINWIDPEGYIRWVSPYEPNKNAVNRHVLSRPELTPYLLSAKEERTTKISHVIDLYQGPKGLSIYVPIYHGDQFKGWYNGVINVEDTLSKFFEERGLKSINFSFSVKNYDDVIFTFGHAINDSNNKKINIEFPIFNQNFIITASFDRTSMTATRTQQLGSVFILIYVSIAIITIFIFYLIRTQFIVQDLNRKLTRDRTLINILSHDMATPLTLISENIKRLKEKLKNENYPEVDRILRSSEKQMSLLTRVRSFHATNIGRIHIELIPVSANELITEALNLFEESFAQKQITYQIEHPEGMLYCLTDRLTAVDNVLGNVLSNAIKFSDAGSTIKIRSYTDGPYTVIEVQDFGFGIPKEVLANLFEEKQSTSRQGTSGERGTGLGMLQIKAFMEYYKGKVKIETSNSGTRVMLYFRSSSHT